MTSKLTVWAMLSLLLAFGAQAEDVKASSVLICGTADQAKHFVNLHQDVEGALASVNDSSKSCLVAGVAYVAGKQFDRVERKSGTYVVTEITIVGVATPYGMLATAPSVVYTVLKVDEEAA